MDSFTDDVLASIFCHFPARSLCCCECVCRSWKRVISDSYHRKKLPQIVVGFFYGNWWTGKSHFTSTTGERPSLSFLPFTLDKVLVSDCYSGLVLCWFCGSNGLRHYVVCNPVTEKCHALPRSIISVGQGRLGFEPTKSSRFHVIDFVEVQGLCIGVQIYSSKTAAWIFKKSKWGENTLLRAKSRSVFLNGFMHIFEYSVLLVVDMEGQIWRKIFILGGCKMSIHQSQGQLCICSAKFHSKSWVPVWTLEDYGTDNWRLKHVVDTECLFGDMNIKIGSELRDEDYRVITLDPESNLIFFIRKYGTLIAYDTESRKVHVIDARVICFRRTRRRLHIYRPYYLPYIPLFMESLAEK